MKFGVLKDIKVGEYRVIATPAEVSMIASDGHEVYVQRGREKAPASAMRLMRQKVQSWLIQRRRFTANAILLQR